MEKKSPIQPAVSFKGDGKLNIGAQLADLKLHFYHQSLLVTALIESLVGKGIIQQEELAEIAMNIDKDLVVQMEREMEIGENEDNGE